MAISINDLDDDDILEEGNEPTPEPLQQPTQQQTEDDFMSDFLKSKGIQDPSKIKFEDEQGNIEEKDWKNLTKEEKINILNTPLQETDNTSVENNNNLDEEEINLINQIRESGLTPSKYLEQLQGGSSSEPTYKIDDLSDDEIYLLDLESRVGELSDDEAAQALTIAKQNEDFYKKQVEGIRKEYKEREDFESKQNEEQLKQEQEEAYNNYANQIIGAINQFNSIGDLDLNLEDKDKEDLAEFMLSQDQSGVNYLYQALQDPETLVKAAWFILNGEEAFNNVSDYFSNQIKLASDSQYKKGFQDGQKGNNPSRPTVFIDNSKKKQNLYREYKTIEDLDDED